MGPLRDLPPSADSVAKAGHAMFRDLVAALEGAWMVEADGADAVVTGISSTSANGVWTTELDPDAGTVDGLLDRVAGTGLPHCLAVRGAGRAAGRVAERRGMVLESEEPVMILTEGGALQAAIEASPDLSIRQLGSHEGGLHAAVAGAAFDATPADFESLTTASVLSIAGRLCYVGAIEGVPVVTGTGVTLAGTTAIFAVATRPEHRGRGYGAALTAFAVTDGLRAGARWAWLQSSPEGYRVYERLGFRTVETGAIWATI